MRTPYFYANTPERTYYYGKNSDIIPKASEKYEPAQKAQFG